MKDFLINFASDVKDHEYHALQINGDIDSQNYSFASAYFKNLIPNLDRQNVLFDLSGVNFINSSGLGLLVEIHTKLMRNKQRLIFAAPRENVRDILNLVGLPKIIPLFETVGEAIQYIKKGSKNGNH